MTSRSRAADASRKLDPRDPFRGNPNPMRFTPEQRANLNDRFLLQKPPTDGDFEAFAELMRRKKTIEGIPVDVLFTLEAIRQLAEQGNKVAERLYWTERVRLGIDVPKRFGPR